MALFIWVKKTEGPTAARLKMLDIDWEYPPEAFQVELTKDGVHWHSVYTVDSGLVMIPCKTWDIRYSILGYPS